MLLFQSLLVVFMMTACSCQQYVHYFETWLNVSEELSTIRLQCNATGNGTVAKEIDWEYVAPALNQSYGVLIFDDGGYEGPAHKPKHALDQSDNTTLVISNISFTDTGTYICVEKFGHGSRHYHHLSVRPRKHYVDATLGQPVVRLQCPGKSKTGKTRRRKVMGLKLN
jgi:hypothetical protein